ncbi:MAG: hypothetical protein LBH59_01505 [Planctomycetaceae bacterium]|nr:hypothetical protein [Planctomycetaceae bacterium]
MERLFKGEAYRPYRLRYIRNFRKIKISNTNPLTWTHSRASLRPYFTNP